jgi:glucokinase
MPGQRDNPLVVGIDLGGTKILAAVVAADNSILGRSKAPTPAHEGGPAILQVIIGCVDAALAEAGVGRGDIVAAGIGSPGPLDPSTGVILFSGNLNLRDFPLGPRLSQALGWPVVLQNDVRVGGYAEFRLGAAKGCTDVIAAFVGTGIGGCIISRGEVLAGSTGNAGEIGHIVVKANGPQCGCGARGCLEAMASRTAIAHRVNKAIRKGTPTILREKLARKGGRLKSGDLADAVAAGDLVAVTAVSRAAYYLGLGLGSLINTLGPQIVVIGGGVAEALGDPWLAQVRDIARRQALVDRDGTIRIEPAALGDDAGIHGAALLARESVASPGTHRDGVAPSTPTSQKVIDKGNESHPE